MIPLLKYSDPHPASEEASESPDVLAIKSYADFEELTPSCLRLFEEAGRQNFFLTLPWFRNFAATALDTGCRLRIYGAGEPAAGMFLARSSGRELYSATNFYSCLFAPHLPVSGSQQTVVHALVTAIAAEKPRWEKVEIYPLDVDTASFSGLVEAFRAAGFVVQTYFCFGNWHLAVNDRTFAEYVESLPAVLRNTLNRKRKRLEKSGRGKIQIVTGGDDLEKAINDYTKVYLASWKQPEPYPEFITGLVRMCAAMGALRLGFLYVDGEPAAAQLWIVHNHSALIYKLAYDERFADLSVGTILTAALMQHVIDVDRVNEVDYLSGDDTYKKDWMSHRRERWGILAMNPRTLRGLMMIVRHVGGRALKLGALWLGGRSERNNCPGATQTTSVR